MSKLRITDPRHVAETFANEVVALHTMDNNVYMAFGIERPALGAAGEAGQWEREIIARIVVPVHAAKHLVHSLMGAIAAAEKMQKEGLLTTKPPTKN